MEKLNFSDCKLYKIERVFGLKAADSLPLLDSWVSTNYEISAFDKQCVHRLWLHLQKNVLSPSPGVSGHSEEPK